MNIFLICPVRNTATEYQKEIESVVSNLEDWGHTVYYPRRDTNQESGSLNICMSNRAAIARADVVYVIWNGTSQGVLFDLGMAFALNKPVVPVAGLFPGSTPEKSFQNLVYEWRTHFAQNGGGYALPTDSILSEQSGVQHRRSHDRG